MRWLRPDWATGRCKKVLTVVVAATVVPARRAACIDPKQALRAE
ncbi:MAG TPA: hypothetical protein VKB88_14645 [Bryobacteraceae bacterium]|nr:hypothetical protein [Bryobacteraceae bacterium]